MTENFSKIWFFLSSFLLLGLNLATLIVGLDCIWRTKRHFKVAMIFLTLAVAVRGVWLGMLIFRQSGSLNSQGVFIPDLIIGFVSGLLFLFAFINFYEIIKILEKSDSNQSK